VLSSLALSGGVRVVIEYANHLAERGHEVVLLAPGGTLAEEFSLEISADIQVIEAGIPFSSAQTLYGKIRLVIELARLLPKADAIIATHTPTTAVTFLAGSIMGKGTPIWLYQDYPGMFENRPFERYLLHNALNWHAGALTISGFSKKQLESFGITRRVFLVGEGLSRAELLKPISAKIREASKPPCPTIFYLGDMRPRKGMLDFLQAVEIIHEKVPDLLLWIASKEDCIINTTIPYKFFKRPDDELLAKLYGSCDVFVSSSWWEGFGLPPLEAMACGAPVVTTDSQGVREFARDRENCLVVPARNPLALAAAILQLITEPQLAQKLRENGPQTAALFGWDDAVDRFETALRELVRG
jgi:glycosyltransferase involved in cell wall biosynthesis